MADARRWLAAHGGQVPAESSGSPASDSPNSLGPNSLGGSRQGAAAARGVARQERTGLDGADADPEAKAEADPEAVARTIVLRKLAAQARTRSELQTALAAREVPAAASEAVLDRMTEVGLVDDARFARDWVSSRQVRRKLSKSALRRELTAKGVERTVVDDALAETATTDERSLALDLALSKLRGMHGVSREVKMRRLAGVLGRRGFGAAVVASVVTESLRRDGHEVQEDD